MPAGHLSAEAPPTLRPPSVRPGCAGPAGTVWTASFWALARGSSLEPPVPLLSQPSPGGGRPRQPSTGTSGVISLQDVAKCFQSSQPMRRTRAASPFPASPRGRSQPGASAASGLQCPGQLTPLGRPGVGRCGEEGRDSRWSLLGAPSS